jgi:hypothetical protein
MNAIYTSFSEPTSQLRLAIILPSPHFTEQNRLQAYYHAYG